MAQAGSKALTQAAKALSSAVSGLRFGGAVTHVYNPLGYAWAAHAAWVRRFGGGPRRVLMMGMNPGPWGMAQTGVPFGEVAAVRDWLGIDEPIDRAAVRDEHPKRPIEGMACGRSEVSGRRLWGLFAERYGEPGDFFAAEGGHWVTNYCPLVFMAETGRNVTPDKLGKDERAALEAACDARLVAVLRVVRPTVLVGIGKYAEAKLARVVAAHGVDPADGGEAVVGSVLHPSPASPAANRGWAERATAQLVEMGAWAGR
ncbi:MAG: uracil-DNA glycosylase family protein [Planctomycetota bacterium]